MIPKKYIILYSKHLLSFLRFAISGSVVVDLCIVVGGVVGVMAAVSLVGVGSVSTDEVSADIDSVVVMFVTKYYIELVLILTA